MSVVLLGTLSTYNESYNEGYRENLKHLAKYILNIQHRNSVINSMNRYNGAWIISIDEKVLKCKLRTQYLVYHFDKTMQYFGILEVIHA